MALTFTTVFETCGGAKALTFTTVLKTRGVPRPYPLPQCLRHVVDLRS